MSDQATEPRPDGSVWSTKPRVDLAQLDDKRVTAYRHPDEHQALISIALGFAALLIALAVLHPSVSEALRLVPSTLTRALADLLHPARAGPLILVALLAMMVVDSIGSMLHRYELPYGSVEITPVTFPQLGPVVEELARRFEMPETRVYAAKSAPAGGNAIGVAAPYLISFSTGILGSLTVDEFRFLLGRQMGHVKLRHTRTALLFGSSVPLSFAWLNKFRKYVFGNYQRATELSADRIGLLATRDIQPVLSFMTKSEVGVVRGAKIDLESLTPRATELQQGREARIARLRQLLTTQPSFVFRLLELTQWAGLPPPAPSAPASTSPATPGAATGASGAAPAAPGGPGAVSAAAPAAPGTSVAASPAGPAATGAAATAEARASAPAASSDQGASGAAPAARNGEGRPTTATGEAAQAQASPPSSASP
jgi:Zn-dependent protease with chaperone function